MGQGFARLRIAAIAVCAAVAAFLAPQMAVAQDELQAGEAPVEAVEGAAGGYAPMAPTQGVGMPTAYEDGALASMTFQDQYTAMGQGALFMHDYILLPVITIISLLVLGLLLYVIVRFNRRANPVPSKTTHNTAIEVIWTIVPVIVLVIIAVPSLSLLARQYQPPPEDAVTIKATGYQWYWGYTYPDHGEIEIISNMLDQTEVQASGEGGLYQLAVDNRMVVPADTPLRIQTTGADVIHAFAVPSLWFKMDAVPGRLNEKLIEGIPEGVYYGQCSELCGALHGYMPIAVEALPPAEFEAWVLENGGTMPGAEEQLEEEAAAPEEATAEDVADTEAAEEAGEPSAAEAGV